MKAVVLKGFGGVDQLFYEEAPTPRPGDGEVLVKMAAISLNPIDWKVRSGAMQKIMPVNLPTILGSDLAGEIVELGGGVTNFNQGQRVVAFAGQSYAEFVRVKAEVVAPIPEGLSFEQAAALPVVTLTGRQLIERGVKAQKGQTILLTGALGGVGRTAAYVAGLHGAKVIAAVRPAQVAEVKALGVHEAISLEDEAGLEKFAGLDAFADTVGGAVAAKLLKLLKRGGDYVTVVGPPPGVANFDVHVEMFQVKPDGPQLAQLVEDVAQGRLSIPIAKIFKLAEVREAHRFAETGGAGGKIVLVP